MADVVIRCDASAEVGLGHLTRSMALATALEREQGLSAQLLITEDPLAAATITRAGISIAWVAPAEVDRALRQAIEGCRALVLDYRGKLKATTLASARARKRLIVTIDDPTSRRLKADLAFYPPMPQLNGWDWTGFSGDLFVGWEWVVLRQDLIAERRRPAGRIPRVLISMGGSDPDNVSAVILQSLPALKGECAPLLVIGGVNKRGAALEQLARAKGVDCVTGPSSYPQLVRDTDIALVAFGVSAYEFAACRIPALYLCLTEDHRVSATAFEKAGLGRIIGMTSAVSETQIRRYVTDALADYGDMASWMHRVPPLVDGRGASRIAARIAGRLN